jgi:hypothetical protein
MKQMDKERDKKKEDITRQIDQVTKRNLEKMETREAEKKKKEKISEAVVVDVTEPAVVTQEEVARKEDETEAKMYLRKEKAPTKEIKEIGEAQRQRAELSA